MGFLLLCNSLPLIRTSPLWVWDCPAPLCSPLPTSVHPVHAQLHLQGEPSPEVWSSSSVQPPPCWTLTHKFLPPLLPQFQSRVSPTQCNHCGDPPQPTTAQQRLQAECRTATALVCSPALQASPALFSNVREDSLPVSCPVLQLFTCG